jgi:hypothetical protein
VTRGFDDDDDDDDDAHLEMQPVRNFCRVQRGARDRHLPPRQCGDVYM